MQPLIKAWQLLWCCLASFRFRAAQPTPLSDLLRGMANPKRRKSCTQRQQALSRLVALIMAVSTLLPTVSYYTVALPTVHAQTTAVTSNGDGIISASSSTSFKAGLEFKNGMTALYVANGSSKNYILSESPDSLDGSYDTFVSVSPDNKKVIFVTSEPKQGFLTNTSVWTVNIDGSNRQKITSFPGQQLWTVPFAWSPDSHKLAYVLSENGELQIWTMNSDGTNQTKVLDQGKIFSREFFMGENKNVLGWSSSGTALEILSRVDNKLITVDLASGNATFTPVKLPKVANPKVQSPAGCGGALPNPLPANYLPVPCFSQVDPQWANTPIGNNGDSSCTTIGKVGCLLTSAAMILKYYGLNTNPSDLNSRMGQYACPFYWQIAVNVSSNAAKSYKALGSYNLSVIEQNLNQGYPVIVGTNNVHFVVVTGGTGTDANNYTVNESFSGTNTTSLQAFIDAHGTPDQMDIFVGTGVTQPTIQPPQDPGSPTVDDSDSGAVIGGNTNYWHIASCANYQCRSSSMHYTSDSLSNNSNNTVEWHPNLPVAGVYQVFVDIPNISLGTAYTTGANYQIHYKGGQVATQAVNQQANSTGTTYSWVSIGQFDFDAGSGDYVHLDDVVPEKGHLQAEIAFDAVSFKLISPDVTIPNAPSNLSTSTASTSQINVSWTGNGGDGFYVERKTGTGGTYSRINQTTNANYQDSGLASNTQYCYRVQAYNSAGSSGYSNESCATTLNATTLSIDKTQLNFTYVQGDANPPMQPVMLSTSSGNITWTIYPDWLGGAINWVGYSASANTVSPSNPVQFYLGVYNNLTAGTYNCDIYFGDSANSQNYAKIHITLVVQAAPNINIGQGSSYPQNYIDAYNRRSSSYYALDYAQQYPGSSEWWQKLSSGAAIFHDQASSPNPAEVRAYYISGGNLAYYLNLGGPNSWLGVPTSDEFLNANSLWQVDYANGYAYDNGQGTIITTAWPSNVSGWKTSYFNNQDLDSGPTYVTNDTTDTATNLNIAWPTWAAPMPQEGLVFDNNWSARFEQVVNFQIGQYYRITACGDDGVRVFMSGNEVINGWQDQNVTCYNYFYYQDAISPNNVPIKIEYFQNIGGASLQFTITPITLQLSPLLSNNQATQINTQFPNNLSVLVTDQFGDYVNGVTVSLSAPTSGASGTWPAGITPGNVSTTSTLPSDNNGVAATTYPFTANNIAGTYTVKATVNGVSNVSTTFTLTNITGPATSITILAGENQSTQINTAFGTNLQVLVKDAGGNPIRGLDVIFSAPTTNASGIFIDGTSATVNTSTNGVATAPTFTANSIAGTYNVVVSVNGVASTASFALTNTNPSTTVATTVPTTVATTAPTAAPTTAPTNSPTTVAPTTTPIPTTPVPVNNAAYTYHLPYVANNGAGIGGNYTTNVTLQNMGSAPATFTITYYDNGGNTLATDSDNGGTLAPNTKYNPAGLASGQSGAATIVSTQPLSIVVSESGTFNGKTIASSYPDINTTTGVGSTIYAPIALNHSYGSFSTGLMLRNTGTSDTTVTIQYYNDYGNPTGSQTVSIKAQNTVQVLQSDAAANLPNNFSGWASITSNNGQPLAGIDVETNPDTGFVATVACTATPGKTVYVPVVFQEAFGNFITGMQLVNPNNTTANVTVTITRKDGTVMQLSLAHASFQMAAHSDKSFFDSADVFPELLTANGGFVGTATITSDQPLLAIVNQSGSVGSVNFNGSFGTVLSGAAQVNMPSVFKNASAFSSGLQIVNTSSTASTATITYYDSNGNKVYQAKLTADDGGPIKPGGSINPYQGSDPYLPSNFNGTAVISADSSGASFVVVGNISDGKIFYTYAEPN